MEGDRQTAEVGVLALKLLLTPTIMVAATLAGRRFGRAVSGWFIGLPLTSGPIALIFAVEHGHRFAAHAATGSLGGAIAEVGFCLGYAFASRHSWQLAVLGGSAGFAAVAGVLEALSVGLRPAAILVLAACALAALMVGLSLVHGGPPVDDEVLPSRWDIPARAIVTTAFLLALTALATTFGPSLSGLLAVYPLYSVVMAAFAHRSHGAAAARQVLRGLLFGLFSFVAFYCVLAIALPRIGTGAAFGCALVATLTVQAATIPLLFATGARSSVDRATAF